jgi:electron transfer flavoprotein alpha subunit
MEKIWILAETRDGEVMPIAAELAAAARQFAPTVEAFVWGGRGDQAAVALGAHGVGRVFDIGDIGDSLAGPVIAAAIAHQLVGSAAPDAILIGTTADGRDIAARLSARVDLPVIANVVGLEESDGALVSSHAAFGGNEIVTARFTGAGPGIFLVRSKSFAAVPTGGAAAELVAATVPDLGSTDGAKVLEHRQEDHSGPSLDDAAIVVSGGRGLGTADKYALIEELAGLLGGAPGASRAIVDVGWVPYSHQVGQTGKVVKPEVYLAFGISGATQHMVGMKGANHIIAVNKDPQAAMLAIADLGVVGDLHQVLPKLIEALKARSQA